MILEESICAIDPKIRTQSFADPVPALEWAKSNHLDLVITDYKMPNMNGTHFTHWLRQIPGYADVPIVITTSREEQSALGHALKLGASDFLTKPIDHTECRLRCRNLLLLRQQQQTVKDRASWVEMKIANQTEERRI